MKESFPQSKSESDTQWSRLTEVTHDPAAVEMHSLATKALALSPEDRELVDWSLNAAGYRIISLSAAENPDKIELILDDLSRATTDTEKRRIAKMIAEEI